MKAIARALSLAAAALVVTLLVLYPRGILRPDGTVPFGPMALLLLGMSAAWVHCFGDSGQLSSPSRPSFAS